MIFSVVMLQLLIFSGRCYSKVNRFFTFEVTSSPSIVTATIKDVWFKALLECGQDISCVACSFDDVDAGAVKFHDGAWLDNKVYNAGRLYVEMKETLLDFNPQQPTPLSVPIRAGLRAGSGFAITYTPIDGWERCSTKLFCCCGDTDIDIFYLLDLRHTVGQTKIIVNNNKVGGSWRGEQLTKPWITWPFVAGVPFTFMYTITASSVQVTLDGGTGPYHFDYVSRGISPDCVKKINIEADCVVNSIRFIHVDA